MTFEQELAAAYRRGGRAGLLKACDEFIGDSGKPKVPTNKTVAALLNVPHHARSKAMDALVAKSTPLFACEDGCIRSAEQIKVWRRNGFKDEMTEQRAELQKKHCGGQCSVGGRPGHLCSCKH